MENKKQFVFDELTQSFDADLQMISDYLQEYLNTLNERPVYYQDAEVDIKQFTICDEPESLAHILTTIKNQIDSKGVTTTHGGFLAYSPGGGLPSTGYADLIADVTNHYSGVYFTSPGAAMVEQSCLQWFSSLLGYDENAYGNLTSGGSIANLIALVAARDALNISSSVVSRSVVYTTHHVHHSVYKALKLIGLGECIIREISVDEQYRMQSTALQEIIVADSQQGLLPKIVVASFGTTNTGTIDPIQEIGKIAKQYGLWFHVDAAYGGFFLLCNEIRDKYGDLAVADSVVIDPHKGLFLSYGVGAVLVKQKQHLLNSFSMTADYMQDFSEDSLYTPANISPELSRPFRELRVWLSLKRFGVKAFKQCLQEKLDLTQLLYQQLQQLPNIVFACEPELSVVTFRFLPRKGSADDFNQQLLATINQDGRIFISSTALDNCFYLRIACLSFRTHQAVIEKAVTIIHQSLKACQYDEKFS